MPTDNEEVIEAREENNVIYPGWDPQEIIIEDGVIKGLIVAKCLAIFDEEGRFNPQFNMEQRKVFEADMNIESIGQDMYVTYTDKIKEQLEFSPRGRINVSKKSQSALPCFFVGGNIIEGPDIIHGIANGHKAAVGIDRFLNGDKQ